MSENSGKPFAPPPPPPSSLREAGQLARYQKLLAQGLPVVKGSYFRGQPVHLDGYRFEGCRFDNCHIFVNTTNFELDHCILDPSSIMIFGEDLIKVIRLFNREAEWGSHYASWGPQKNTDGTITITGANL